ncbi:hypothetical protein Tco_1277504 [Tanacetum coccineum]
MADHSQKWHDESTSRRVSNDSSVRITAITNKLDILGRDMKKNVHAIQVGCENYGGADLNKECPPHEEVKSVKEVKYGEFGQLFLNNNGNGARYHVGPPGYYTRVDNRLPFGSQGNKGKATRCLAIPTTTERIECRPFLAIIHARIDVFDKEISLRVLRDGEFKFWPTYDPSSKVCNTGDRIHRLDEQGKIKQCKCHHMLKMKQKGQEMFPDLLLIKYGKRKIDDTVWQDGILSGVDDNKTTLDMLANEFELSIGKKGYFMDDIWEKCERVHERTPYPWHDGGHKEEEK